MESADRPFFREKFLSAACGRCICCIYRAYRAVEGC